MSIKVSTKREICVCKSQITCCQLERQFDQFCCFFREEWFFFSAIFRFLLSLRDVSGWACLAAAPQRRHWFYYFNDSCILHLLGSYMWQHTVYLAEHWTPNHLSCNPASEDPRQEVQSGFPDCLAICWGRHHWDQMTKTEFFFSIVCLHSWSHSAPDNIKGTVRARKSMSIPKAFAFGLIQI